MRPTGIVRMSHLDAFAFSDWRKQSNVPARQIAKGVETGPEAAIPPIGIPNSAHHSRAQMVSSSGKLLFLIYFLFMYLTWPSLFRGTLAAMAVLNRRSMPLK
jgi:hypothetical protein